MTINEEYYGNTNIPSLRAIITPTVPKDLDELFTDHGNPHWDNGVNQLTKNNLKSVESGILSYLDGMNTALCDAYDDLISISTSYQTVVEINDSEKMVGDRFDEIVSMLTGVIGQNENEGVWGNARENMENIESLAAQYTKNNTEECHPRVETYDKDGDGYAETSVTYHDCPTHGLSRPAPCSFCG